MSDGGGMQLGLKLAIIFKMEIFMETVYII